MENVQKHKMSNEEKLKVYENFKERKAEDIIANKGETCTYGITTITIKELPWEDADIFEDKVLELVSGIVKLLKTNIDDKDKIVDTLQKIDISALLDKFFKVILRQGLVDLANIASLGEVTMDSIKKNKVTKSQVIKIVTKAVHLNYGYLKNLIPQIAALL